MILSSQRPGEVRDESGESRVQRPGIGFWLGPHLRMVLLSFHLAVGKMTLKPLGSLLRTEPDHVKAPNLVELANFCHTRIDSDVASFSN